MADNFLNKIGLQYYHDNIKTIFADKSEIPTNTSDLTNDGDGTDNNSPFATVAGVQSSIDTALSSAFTFKGSVATVADLPVSGNKVGDVYDVQATGMNYAWNGSAWDALGQYVDTSLLWAKAELTAITTSEIDNIVAGS